MSCIVWAYWENGSRSLWGFPHKHQIQLYLPQRVLEGLFSEGTLNPLTVWRREESRTAQPKSITVSSRTAGPPPTELTNVQPTDSRCPERKRKAGSSALGSSSTERTLISELQMIASISLVSFWWMFQHPMWRRFVIYLHISLLSLSCYLCIYFGLLCSS